MSSTYSLAYRLQQQVLIWFDPTSVNQDYFHNQLETAKRELGYVNNRLNMVNLESTECRRLGMSRWVEFLGNESKNLEAIRKKHLRKIAKLERVVKDLPSD